MASPSAALRRVAAPAAAGAATVLVFLAWVTWVWGGTRVSTTMDDTMQIVAPLAAAAGCAVAARRHAGRERFAWSMLAASCAVWAAGSVLWGYYEVLRGEDPFPSLADAGYLLAVPFAATALVALHPTTRGTAARVLLDGAIVALATLCVSWAFILGPLFRAHGVPLLDKAIGLTYPLSDVLLFTLALSLLARVHGRNRLSIALVAGGLLQLSLADSIFTYLTSAGTYGAVNPVDTLWVSGYLCIALGAVVPRSNESYQADRHVGMLAAVLPYALVVCSGVVGGVFEIGRGSIEGVVFWAGLANVILLIIRQGVLLWDNLGLTRRLEQRVAERTHELAASRRKFEAMVMRSSDSITLVDATGRLLYQSRDVNPVTGYARDDRLGRSSLDLVHPTDRERLHAVVADLVAHPGATLHCEARLRHADGSWRVCEVQLTNLLTDPDVQGVVVNLRDITARKQLEERLVHDALHDRLTGLANRAVFRDRLEQALARHRRWQTRAAVLFVDLDGFKSVNDTMGHGGGDAVLVQVARRLAGCTRASDTVARLGGDEFGVIVESRDDDDAVEVATRIVAALDEPLTVSGREVFVGASIGVAQAGTGDIDPDRLVRNADVAMYVAKSRGRGRIEVYDERLHSDVLSSLELEADIRHCVDRNELRVEFQPLVALGEGRPVGFEALVRWHHPRRGVVRPDLFIPIAERTGVILDIGRWVLGEACWAARGWRDAGASDIYVSVNVSALQLREPGFLDDVDVALHAAGLAGDALVVELTESALVSEHDAVLQVLQTLRARGVRVAVDDFGTGYSSLNYLQSFPFDLLKVDRAFVDGPSDDGTVSLLARTILELCDNMHIPAIAEGIERREQAVNLAAARCAYGQGYYFARPMPPDRALDYLRGWIEDAVPVEAGAAG